ncbi:MAG TPA: tripartite tricarboxylate transporter substrate binding protein [Burkholderiales bacterium]|nr:tripartite tricarboxylate transporter substrate binding protein [Burkholderiales bacterium]
MTTIRLVRTLLAALAAAIVLLPGAAIAQPVAGKQMRVILTYPPGGASDIMGRIIAQKLGEIWSQSVLVENRAGANGAIGIEYAARQPADGTSFVIGNLAPVAINPLISKVPYNMARDFQPVSLVASAPTILVTHVSIPAKNLQEFVKLAKSRPGQVNWGTAGPGTLGHLGGEMLKRLAKIDMLHVPYKGGVLAIQDLLAGNVHLVFADPQPIIPHIRAGKVRPLAITSAKRSAAVPDIPTFAEAGVPGFVAENWWGVYVPAATPKPQVDRLHGDLVKTMGNPDLRERFAGMSVEPMATTPDALRDFMNAEIDRWGKLIREAGIRVD